MKVEEDYEYDEEVEQEEQEQEEEEEEEEGEELGEGLEEEEYYHNQHIQQHRQQQYQKLNVGLELKNNTNPLINNMKKNSLPASQINQIKSRTDINKQTKINNATNRSINKPLFSKNIPKDYDTDEETNKLLENANEQNLPIESEQKLQSFADKCNHSKNVNFLIHIETFFKNKYKLRLVL